MISANDRAKKPTERLRLRSARASRGAKMSDTVQHRHQEEWHDIIEGAFGKAVAAPDGGA